LDDGEKSWRDGKINTPQGPTAAELMIQKKPTAGVEPDLEKDKRKCQSKTLREDATRCEHLVRQKEKGNSGKKRNIEESNIWEKKETGD